MIEGTNKASENYTTGIQQSSPLFDKVQLLKKHTDVLEIEAEKLIDEKGNIGRTFSKQKSLELHMKITSKRVQIILLSEGIPHSLPKP